MSGAKSAAAHKGAARFYGFLKWFYLCLGIALLAMWLSGRFNINPWGFAAYPPFLLLFHFLQGGASADKVWALRTSLVLAVILLFAFPIGTVIGFVLLSYCGDWKQQQDRKLARLAAAQTPNGE